MRADLHPPMVDPRTGDGAVSPRWLLLLAEIALVGLTAAGVVGLARLFSDGSFLLPVLAFAMAGHALAALCRRRRLPVPTTVALAAGGLVAGISIFLLPETTRFGLPTAATLGQAGRELSEALAAFRAVVAPAPVQPGFVLAAATVSWVVAFVADSAAFRARARAEAAVPAATLFLFGAALGAPPHRIPVTALFLVALVAYWLTQRVLTHWSEPHLMAQPGHADAGPHSLLRGGALLGAVAVMAAVVVGPLLPGAEASAVIPWRSGDRGGPGSRVTISPLVDIRSRMVDQSDVEVFSVDSDARAYWRLTSLEIFDGRIWSSRGQYREIDGGLSDGSGDDLATTGTIVQDFEIADLASIWLPAAYRAVRLEGVEARFDDASASLLTEEEQATGLRYRVTSEVRGLDAGALAQVPNVAPAEVAETYTALPADFSPEVQMAAARITQDAPTQYERARSLQDHFRGGSFSYDLSVAPGHGDDDLERFLFESRRGYCEQFAGAFAAMARSIGLPTRVAVGFTPGEPDAEGRLVVRGLNAHAWPEVYLAGYGWVAFEPTPGRGIPGAEAYTGVAEQQAAPANPTTATTRPPSETVPPTATAAGQGTPTTAAEGDGADRQATSPTAPGSPWPSRVVLALGVVIGLPLAWAGALALFVRRRQERRRAGARTADQRVLVAWSEVGESLARAGTPPREWETPMEYAQRAGGATGIDHRLLNALAGVTTAAGWGPHGVGEDVADQATRAASELRQRIERALDTKTRLRLAFDPRPLLPARKPRLDVRVSST